MSGEEIKYDKKVLDAYAERQDVHWQEVMDLAKKYGFICQSYGGVTTLGTHKNQRETYGDKDYIYRQEEMMGNKIT